jgi:hypothetical protein
MVSWDSSSGFTHERPTRVYKFLKYHHAVNLVEKGEVHIQPLKKFRGGHGYGIDDIGEGTAIRTNIVEGTVTEHPSDRSQISRSALARHGFHVPSGTVLANNLLIGAVGEDSFVGSGSGQPVDYVGYELERVVVYCMSHANTVGAMNEVSPDKDTIVEIDYSAEAETEIGKATCNAIFGNGYSSSKSCTVRYSGRDITVDCDPWLRAPAWTYDDLAFRKHPRFWKQSEFRFASIMPGSVFEGRSIAVPFLVGKCRILATR